MSFVDFSALKDAVSFERAMELLDLKLKRSGNQWRGPCPACTRAGDRALVITEGRGFYCWGVKAGGDQIALTGHILSMNAKQAAQELAERAGLNQSREPDRSRDRPRERGGSEQGEKTLEPLSYLEHDHPAVDAVGFDPEFAAAHGIGWAGKGVARGHVLIPFRDEHGNLLGYVGVTEAWLPAEFRNKVVELKKRA